MFFFFFWGGGARRQIFWAIILYMIRVIHTRLCEFHRLEMSVMGDGCRLSLSIYFKSRYIYLNCLVAVVKIFLKIFTRFQVYT